MKTILILSSDVHYTQFNTLAPAASKYSSGVNLHKYVHTLNKYLQYIFSISYTQMVVAAYPSGRCRYVCTQKIRPYLRTYQPYKFISTHMYINTLHNRHTLLIVHRTKNTCRNNNFF